MIMAKNTSTVDQARTALETAEAERDRFRTSIETLTAQIQAETDLAVAMPLHTELETRRLFLLRAEGKVTKAKIDLADAEREADLSRKAALAKTADPAACLAKMVEQGAKVASAVRALREARAVLYDLAEVQRFTANEAGSTQLPKGSAAAIEALACFNAHEPSLRVIVPRIHGEMIPTVLAGFDALAVATDTAFRAAHSDDALIAAALKGTLLASHTAWVADRTRQRAEGQAALEARKVAHAEAKERWHRDRSNETALAEYKAAEAAWLAPAEPPPVIMPTL
jgi:hypothetical protein